MPAAPTGGLPWPPGFDGGVAALVPAAETSAQRVPWVGRPLSEVTVVGLITWPVPKVTVQGEAGAEPGVCNSKLPSLMPAVGGAVTVMKLVLVSTSLPTGSVTVSDTV